VVPLRTKLFHVARALAVGTLDAPTRMLRGARTEIPSVALRFTDGVVAD
jgi:hypothetical protein